jgi:hypothetical protein
MTAAAFSITINDKGYIGLFETAFFYTTAGAWSPARNHTTICIAPTG